MAKEKKTEKTAMRTIAVAELCRELGIKPSKGRARLRKAGWSANGKQYPTMEVDGEKYKEAVEILS